MPSPELSVLICTCRRPEGLRQVLTDLAACRGREGLSWEVVVVDNAPAPEVEAVVAGFRETLPVRYVPEPRRGVSDARNRAVAESQGETVWFLDDDLRVSPGWLQAAVAALRAHPRTAVFVGRITPRYVGGEPPAWLSEEPFRSALAFGPTGRCELGETWGDAPVEYLFGANLGLRRDAFRECGVFRTDFGTAPGWLRGEEHEFYVRLQDAGHRGRYVHDAAVEHLVPADKLTLGFVLGVSYQSGRASANSRMIRRQRLGRHTLLRRLRDLAWSSAEVAWRTAAAGVLGWFLGAGRRVRAWMDCAMAIGRMVGCMDRGHDLALDWPAKSSEAAPEAVPAYLRRK